MFCVDLFNEGVDVPDIDTVMFLRPTESATVFLQQLGRGLRHAEGKPCLTVLDFIGYANKRFRYDQRFRAIVGGTRREIKKHVERGFPLLPSGCSINLDRKAQNAILENIQASLGMGYRGLAEDLAVLGPATTLGEFLQKADIGLEDVYDSPGQCWTALRRQAGFAVGVGGDRRATFERAMSRLLHVDDFGRLDGLVEVLDQLDAHDAANWLQRDLFVLLRQAPQSLNQLPETWAELAADADILHELRELLGLLADQLRRISKPLRGRLASLPLRAHATFSLDEVMAAIDERDKKGAIRRLREGVFYSEALKADLLFVTLEKSEADYSPTTLYNDYPMSPTRFLWESQSNTHDETKVGRRYVNHARDGGEVVLFVRQKRKDARGMTEPYVCLGQATYAGHEGGRPMQIEWELSEAIPSWLYQEMKVVGG